MSAQPHLFVLKRSGWVLVAAGLLYIAALVYLIPNSVGYFIGLCAAMVVGGVALLRGSLRAASTIHWFGAFIFAEIASILLASPLLQPLSLTLTQLRLSQLSPISIVLVFALQFSLLGWLIRELGMKPVLAAQAAGGLKLKSSRLAVSAGIGFTVLLVIVFNLMQRTESAAKAIALTKEQFGPSYQYHLSFLNYKSTGAGASVSGAVSAWSATEVKYVPFQWRD